MEMETEKDVFDYIDEEEEPESTDRSGIVWNILTILVLLSTACVGVVFLMVFLNPNVGFNPFPPPSLPSRMELDTPTATPKDVLPPTWTPTVTLAPTQTHTPGPTETPQPTQEGAAEEPSPTTGQEEPSDMPVLLHEGSPQYIPATSFHPDLGCKWLGVVGQVVNINGAPVQGLLIEVGGTLDGEQIGNPTILQATGLAKAYGDAGYEVKLADEPTDSQGTLWIQVIDQAALPISEKIYFDTFDDCQKNLIIIYFKQIR